MKQVLALAALSVFSGCRARVSDLPAGTPVSINPPPGLPSVPIPADNPPTAEAIALGRKLFYDPRLSFDDSLSCASCHNPALGFADGRRTSSGFGGQFGKRNAPTVLNAAYSRFQFWDGRAVGLEEQAAGPIANPLEMNQTHEVSVTKLGRDPAYREGFRRVFGPGAITIGKVQKVLASFERTLLSANSPFDRYRYLGEQNSLTPEALRGWTVFSSAAKGNCTACHTVGAKYALFTDGLFHNIGVGVDSNGELLDVGRYEQTKSEADKGAFKTPTLRNVAKSGPYMHDGSLKTLRQVVDFYVGGGNSNPHLDSRIKPLSLTGTERSDLVAFLESLTGEMPANAGRP